MMNIRNAYWGLLIIVTALFTDLAFAKEYRVSSAKELKKVESSLLAGDVIVLIGGTWHNQIIELVANGDSDNPITLKAETPGEVILTGNSRLSVKGSYVVVSGLLFSDGALKAEQHIIRLEGSHHRLTQSAIVDYNPKSIDTGYYWVSLYGHHHRVDNNLFTGQNHLGVTTAVWLDDDSSGFHQIDHNYYGQRPEGNANGFESIRIGQGVYSPVDSYVLVENNVFEEVDGEIEIISNKSNYNTYRGNTFLNSAGTLTLRQGTHNIIEGNYFLGESREGSGGVRVISTNQLIINNHFEQLAGRAQGIISITAGNGVFSGDELPSYPQVKNSLIVGNSCINNNAPCVALNANFGSRKRTLIADNLLIASNTFYNDEFQGAFIIGRFNDSIIWSNNFFSGSEEFYPAGEGMLLTSLALDGVFNEVNDAIPAPPTFSCHDIDGLLGDTWGDISQLKPLCDKMITNKSAMLAPLLRNDVGPAWLKIR